MKKILNVIFAAILIVSFAACSEEEGVIDHQEKGLTLNSNTVILSMHLGITSTTVTIESGREGYRVEPSDETIVSVSLSGETITINAISEGSTTITVFDQDENFEIISVIVLNELPASATFNWGVEEIDFDQPDGYGITVLSSSVALTDLSLAHKQYYLSWTGAFTEGNKTDGKLEIVDLNNEVQEIHLNSMTVIKASSTGYFLVFDDGNMSGELFFIK